MKPIILECDEARLKLICSLISLAGSRLGDSGVMMSAADTLAWIQAQVTACQSAEAPRLVEKDEAA